MRGDDLGVEVVAACDPDELAELCAAGEHTPNRGAKVIRISLSIVKNHPPYHSPMKLQEQWNALFSNITSLKRV